MRRRYKKETKRKEQKGRKQIKGMMEKVEGSEREMETNKKGRTEGIQC